MADFKLLIKNIWNKYNKTNPPYSIIEKEAKQSFKEQGGKYKLGTYISWWTRKLATKKSKR